MKLKDLSADHYRGFNKLKVDFHDRLTVLVGRNGAGKTSVLNLAHHALSDLVANLRNSAFPKALKPSDVAIGQSRIGVKTSILFDGNPISWQSETTLKSNGDTEATKDQPAISELLDIGQRHRDSHGRANLLGCPLLVYYDQKRAFPTVGNANVNRSVDVRDPNSAYSQDVAQTMAQFTTWFDQLDADEARKQRTNRSHSDVGLKAVRMAVTSATEFENISYSGEKPAGLRLTKFGVELHPDQISSGEWVLTVLMGDLARRLSLLFPDDPLKGQGVVLIDEIELHLHPAWQRRAIRQLLDTFPNCQFIITTHSPQVLGELHAESIRVLEPNGASAQVKLWSHPTFGQDSNALLESLLGGAERSPDVKEKLLQLDEMIAQNDLSSAKNIIAEIRNTVRAEIPELAISENRIRRRENQSK